MPVGRPARTLPRRRVLSGPAGPEPWRRRRDRGRFRGKVRNTRGGTASPRPQSPNGYTLTTMTSPELARCVLDGAARAGFQTPAGRLGADFILHYEGTRREDL